MDFTANVMSIDSRCFDNDLMGAMSRNIEFTLLIQSCFHRKDVCLSDCVNKIKITKMSYALALALGKDQTPSSILRSSQWICSELCKWLTKLVIHV